jgi:hypothetical protein
MSYNPFSHGNPVSPAEFFDRRQPLRRVVGRLLSGGQSTAIVGEPRTGKTSLLHYLVAPETQADLYGAAMERLIFSYLDTQVLAGHFTPFQFWEQALTTVKARLVDPEPVQDSPIAVQYHICYDNHFGTFTLETLFRLLKENGWWLVLLLDEFDTLLHHPLLNCAEFFGGLRSLASRSGALVLVVASRLPLSALNAKTQELNPSGSPYFNIFAEIALGPFPERDVATLLNRAGDCFTPEDRRAIRVAAGKHPYLLQVAASAMWDAWEEGIGDVGERRRYIGQRLYREHRLHFADTWRIWSPSMRKAFTSVALAHTARLLPERGFLTDAFIEDLRDWAPELDDLEATGLLARDKQVRGGWRVVPQVMLWWLADELVRAVRADTPFEHWLRAQELDGLLTRKELEQLREVVRGAVQVLRQGATTLVEAFAKGVGAGLAGGA